MTSSSSASPRSSLRSLSCNAQPRFQRVAVDATVLQVELVGEILDIVDGLARNEPKRGGLAASPVLLARPRLRELGVGRLDRARVLERLALLLLSEHLEDHVASTSSRTQRSWSRKRLRRARRSAE